MTYYIYAIKHRGKVIYVGSTGNYTRRMADHMNCVSGKITKKNEKSREYLLYKILRKIAKKKGKITFDILQKTTKEKRFKDEVKWVKKYKPIGNSG